MPHSSAEASLEQEAMLFPGRDALWYIEKPELAFSRGGSQGHGYYMAPNPEFGANFTYYLADDIQSLTICSYSGFWKSIWTFFGACVRTAMDILSQLQSFLTLMPHKNSASNKEKPCWRPQDIFSQVSETVSYLSIISTPFS